MIKKLLIGLVVIVAAAVLLLYSRMNSMVEAGAETYGSEALTVPLGLDSVRLSPFGGSITLSGFTIGQPQGYGDPEFPEGPMLDIDDFEMKVDTATLLDKHIVIDSIRIYRPLFDIRMIGSKSNLQAVASRLAAKSSGAAGAGDITLTIREFVLANPRLVVSAKNGPLPIDEDLSLADIRLTDIGTDEQGLAPAEIARHIMAAVEPQVTQALVKAGVEKKLKGVIDANKDKLGGLIGGLAGRKEAAEDEGAQESDGN